MSDLIPAPKRGDLAPTIGASLAAQAADRRTVRELAAVQRQTLVRLASVQGHAMVQNEKLHEVDRLTREALAGHAMLSQWGATLAQT
jgi:hypothetical protein